MCITGLLIKHTKTNSVFPALNHRGCCNMTDKKRRAFHSWCCVGLVFCMVVLIPAGAVTIDFRERGMTFPSDRMVSPGGSSQKTIIFPPRASFTFTQDGNTLTFTDTSKGNPTAWYWTFGDKKNSREQNPSHSYSKRGTYTITLTASNSAGSSTTSSTITIGSPPFAQFTCVQNGKTVAFKDASKGSPTEWLWSFGDGATSTAQNPSHSYVEPGTYTVTLTASNSAGSSTKSESILIGSPPIASFTYTQKGKSVTFKDTTTGNPTAWSWSFGDRKTSRVQNPSHYYSKKGTYIVTLTASNSAGSSTTSSSVVIIP